MTLSISEFFCTVNGSPEIVFSSGTTYYDISGISGWTDFTDQSDSYLYIKLNSIVLDIIRTTDESTMAANMHGGDIFLNYYPSINGTQLTYNALSRDINSYRIDTMTFDEQKVVIQIPDLLSYRLSGGVDYWLNPSKCILMSLFQYLTGEIAIRTSNTINNNNVVLLFKVKIKVHCELFHRL